MAARIEIIFRKGKPVAAFLHFSQNEEGKRGGQVVSISKNVTLHVDDRSTPLGIEIAVPSNISARELNEVLRELGQDAVTEADLHPLRS